MHKAAIGNWITVPFDAEGGSVVFWRRFRASKPVERAVLYMSALGL